LRENGAADNRKTVPPTMFLIESIALTAQALFLCTRC